MSGVTLAASALLFTAACGSHYVNHGTALYADAHYVEAAEVFERTEERLARSSNGERARFGLYRGATFLKLGDVEHAARWLGYARSIATSYPQALSANELALLGASLRAIGNAPSAAPTPAPALQERSTVATAPPAAVVPPRE